MPAYYCTGINNMHGTCLQKKQFHCRSTLSSQIRFWYPDIARGKKRIFFIWLYWKRYVLFFHWKRKDNFSNLLPWACMYILHTSLLLHTYINIMFRDSDVHIFLCTSHWLFNLLSRTLESLWKLSRC